MSNIPQNFLFRFRFPCRRVASPPDAASPLLPEALDGNYRIPFWSQNELREKFAQGPKTPRASTPRNPENEDRFDFRIGWNSSGLLFTVVVRGKKREVRRSHTNLTDSDCVRLCLDLRDVKESRRGSRFCYKFFFYPLVGEEDDLAKPLAQWVPVNRAKETPRPVDVGEFQLASERRGDGYALSAFLPASTLSGCDPDDFARLGVHFSVRDDGFGAFDLQHSSLFPVEDDPSLWATLDFVD